MKHNHVYIVTSKRYINTAKLASSTVFRPIWDLRSSGKYLLRSYRRDWSWLRSRFDRFLRYGVHFIFEFKHCAESFCLRVRIPRGCGEAVTSVNSLAISQHSSTDVVGTYLCCSQVQERSSRTSGSPIHPLFRPVSPCRRRCSVPSCILSWSCRLLVLRLVIAVVCVRWRDASGMHVWLQAILGQMWV